MELVFAADQRRRRTPGAGGVRVGDRVHDYKIMRRYSELLYMRIKH